MSKLVNTTTHFKRIKMSDPLHNSYHAVLFFDVTDGNPGGEPDNNGEPRIDSETQIGFVTGESLRRKSRDTVAITKEGEKGYELHVAPYVPLSKKENECLADLGITIKDLKEEKKKNPYLTKAAHDAFCKMFFDVRAFGDLLIPLVSAAMPAKIIGPVKLFHARSVDPIELVQVPITRCTITDEKDADEKLTDMATKTIVPYGLYRCEIEVNAQRAKQTGFSEEDLLVLWESIMKMFEYTSSQGRGKMNTRKLIIFRHDSPLQNVAKQVLYDTVTVKRVDEDSKTPATKYEDYEINVDTSSLPKTIAVDVLDYHDAFDFRD